MPSPKRAQESAMENNEAANDIRNLINLGPWPKDAEGNYEPPEGAAESCWREIVTMQAVLEDAMATGAMPEGNVALSRLIIEDFVQARRSIELFHCWLAGISPVSEAANRPDDKKVIESPQKRRTEMEQAAETQWALIQAKLGDILPGRVPKLQKETFKSGFLQGAGWAHKKLADDITRMDAERTAKGKQP